MNAACSGTESRLRGLRLRAGSAQPASARAPERVALGSASQLALGQPLPSRLDVEHRSRSASGQRGLRAVFVARNRASASAVCPVSARLSFVKASHRIPFAESQRGRRDRCRLRSAPLQWLPKQRRCAPAPGGVARTFRGRWLPGRRRAQAVLPFTFNALRHPYAHPDVARREPATLRPALRASSHSPSAMWASNNTSSGPPLRGTRGATRWPAPPHLSGAADQRVRSWR